MAGMGEDPGAYGAAACLGFPHQNQRCRPIGSLEGIEAEPQALLIRFADSAVVYEVAVFSDDANVSDACESACDDLEMNGTETDVDCGGDCPPCDPTEMCVVDADCRTGVCEDDSTCVSTTGCAALLALRDATADGIYLFDEDGDATGADPFEAACDMTTDGGGWTLVMKLTSGDMLGFDALQWTAPDLLNETDVQPNDDVTTATDASFTIMFRRCAARTRFERSASSPSTSSMTPSMVAYTRRFRRPPLDVVPGRHDNGRRER